MKIALAQINLVVGGFELNFKKISESYSKAAKLGARVLLTPELSICGYPPHDMLDRPEMFENTEIYLKKIAELTNGQTTALAVGHVAKNPEKKGKPALNAVSIFENGRLVFSQTKSLLPTYDVFDEARYFEPAKEINFWELEGKKIGVAICEDLWGDDEFKGYKLYGTNPVEAYKKAKIDMLLSVSASPFYKNKPKLRENIHKNVAKKLGVPLVYVNQVGATDEIIFYGASFAIDKDGVFKGRLPFFKESLAVLEIAPDFSNIVFLEPKGINKDIPEEIELTCESLVLGVRDYFNRTGFKKVIIGLSGGIDSAVVAALASSALGAENVLGVAMPGPYSSSHSYEDAEKLAQNLGIKFEIRPIKFAFSVLSRAFSENVNGGLSSLAQENLQARIRGTLLMTLANHYERLVLATGNKSELAMGYCTQYGDMVGALAPIGDLYKKDVYALANFLNSKMNNAIPRRIIEKPPSAELKPDQKDEDTLPPYAVLDALLFDYIEENISINELEKKYSNKLKNHPEDWVKKTIKQVEISEYKRLQAAPVLKVTNKAFGIGRRVPVAKSFDI